MTLAEILASEETRRREFPVAATAGFFAHAAVTALPRAAAEALAEYARRGAGGDQESEWAVAWIGRARRAAASLLGADPQEIVLLGPTSLGLNLIARGLPWRPGDEVLVHRDCYPANVYPWERLREQGVKTVPIPAPHPGWITWERLEPLLTPRTRLVALASANFLTGYRVDVDGIGARLRERGILFCVDGIQTLGAFPLPVRHVDFLAADSHKWMLGPCGAGIVYVRKECQEILQPLFVGSWNVISPQFIAQPEMRFHPGARRYEPGSYNLPGIAGMAAALELIAGAGIEAVAARILALRDAILAEARPRGFLLYPDDLGAGPRPDGARGGIVSLAHPRRDVHADARVLRDAGFTVSARETREGIKLLRLSPHFYNTPEEIRRLFATLPAA